MATKETTGEKKTHGRALNHSAAAATPMSPPLHATRDIRSTSSLASPRGGPSREESKFSRAASTITAEEIGANTGTGAPMGLPPEWLSFATPPPPPKKHEPIGALPVRKTDLAISPAVPPASDRPDSGDRSSGRSEKVQEKKKKKYMLREIEELHAQLEEMRSKLQAKNSELETLQTKWWRNTGTDPNTDTQVRSIQAAAACANASAGSEENLKTMLQYGADIHLANGDGRTPLHFAASAGHARVVAFLLESGAQMDVKDAFGRTPFDDACRTKHYRVVQALDEAQAMRQFKTIEKDYKLSDYIVVGKEDIKPRHETAQLQRQLSKLTRFFGEGADNRSKPVGPDLGDALPGHVSSPQLRRGANFSIKDKHALGLDGSGVGAGAQSQPHLNSKSVEFAAAAGKDGSSASLVSASTSSAANSTPSGSSISIIGGLGSSDISSGTMTTKQRKRENRKSAKGLRSILNWRPFGGHSHSAEGDTGNNTGAPRAGAAPYGIAFGRLRGACQADDCHCSSFHNDNSVPGVTVCTCKHFPATHADLGEANILESTHLLAGLEHLNIVDESSTELLLEKEPGVPWPKILNPNLENDEIAKFFSSMSSRADTIVDSRDVEFVRKLGQGASATVYEGTHNGKSIAIKMIDFFPTPKRSLEKIQHEMVEELRVMSALSDVSENVVRYYGVVTQPRFCILLEFCPHGALTDVLGSPKLRMDWPRFFEWAKQITRGVLDLHSWNPPIVHRDLKTLNLLVDADYRVKVADFGLSRFLADDVSQSTLGRMRGTYAYTDPEIYDGIKFSAKADMFSLGIIMWELVYRTLKGEYQRPYAEYPFMNRDFQIIIQVARKNVRPTIPGTCPDLLAQVLRSLWTRAGDDRPDAMELLSTLESINGIYEQNRESWDALLPPLPPIDHETETKHAGSLLSSLKILPSDSSHSNSNSTASNSSNLGTGSSSPSMTPHSANDGFLAGSSSPRGAYSLGADSLSPRTSPLGSSAAPGSDRFGFGSGAGSAISQLRISNTQNSIGAGVGISLSPRSAVSQAGSSSSSSHVGALASSSRSGSLVSTFHRESGAASPPSPAASPLSAMYASPHTSPRLVTSPIPPTVTFHPSTPLTSSARGDSPKRSPRSTTAATFDRTMSSHESSSSSSGKHKRSKSGTDEYSNLVHASSSSSSSSSTGILPVSTDPIKKKHSGPPSEKKDKPSKTPKPEKKKKDKT